MIAPSRNTCLFGAKFLVELLLYSRSFQNFANAPSVYHRFGPTSYPGKTGIGIRIMGALGTRTPGANVEGGKKYPPHPPGPATMQGSTIDGLQPGVLPLGS